MHPSPSIRYLTRDEIDVLKWDRLIGRSANGLPYAYSVYLDHMSKHWGALVLGDYEAAMPLTWNSKYKIAYCYQPPFTAQLGVFAESPDAALVQNFLDAIPRRFRLVEIELNQANSQIRPAQGITMRNNYVLDLNMPYDTLYAGYRDNIKRNIKKALQFHHRFESDIDISDVIGLSKSQMQGISHLTDTDYRNFESLFRKLRQQGRALATGVYDAANQLVASCAYVISNGRACYIMVGNHPNGRTSGASHYLIDRFIHLHAGTPLLLDFEGSDIRNLAFFYSSFGATLETYPSVRINRLPALLSWLKR